MFIMDVLLHLDIGLTSAIYNLPHSTILNQFFAFFSAIGSYGLIWVIAAIYIIVVEERRDYRFVLPFTISLFLAFVLTNFFKNLLLRPRPLSTVYYLLSTNYPVDYSFPSFHATVTFTGAVVLSIFDKTKVPLFILFAVLIAFSRVYLGFHYVGDVLFGALLGIAIAYFSYKLSRLYYR